ncbi:cysteine dioxygenase family protein [Micromonospora echinofusca]|uniref:Cysteine dioxygenase type I n=1 Tax=Micromonospora echinofusca TaxID=47858 RepID=A0A1C5GAA3_MICEH|nr:cysteine dioxygenase family protein [Micromonospora echinofusca]SCG16834.1 Cysteine dioxygenase type I [Micromonospora echinofusca]
MTAPPGGLDALYDAVRAATRTPADWQATADAVAARIGSCLPSAPDVLRAVPEWARRGHESSQRLHVEADGTFSVVALVTRPGQATSIHDHVTWCVVAVIDGVEMEERFRLAPGGAHLVRAGERIDRGGCVTGFAPPGDVHRVSNVGTTVAVSLHIYGTDIGRIGGSVRRTYDLPVVSRTPTRSTA